MLYSKFLKRGSKIAIVCPSYQLPGGTKDIEVFVQWLQDQGMQCVLGKTINSHYFNYSGTDEQRREDLQTFLDDDSVEAIWMGRGGYGMNRIIDDIDFTAFQKNPKWLIGFSDVTTLLFHVFANYSVASIHGAMARSSQEDLPVSGKPVLDILQGHGVKHEIPAHPFNYLGEVEGELIGGNLSIILSINGTASDVDFRDKILFLEDTAEMPHHIDRMIGTLKRSGKWNQIKGLIVGDFNSVSEENYELFGKKPYDIIQEYAQDLSIPVSFGMELGHKKRNLPLIVGKKAKLKVTEKGCVLSQTW